jgi:hypothetical protein
MQQNIPTHAQSYGATFSDPKTIQERECIERALPVRNRFLRIGRSSMTASVGQDQAVFLRESIAASVDPILVTTCTAV